MALSPDRQNELAERASRGIDNSGGAGGGYRDSTRGMNRGYAAADAQRAITRAINDGTLDRSQYDRYQSARAAGDIGLAGRYGRASGDFVGRGDTVGDQIGNALGSAFGFNERNPFSDRTYDPTSSTGDRANYGFDPVGLIGGAVGTAFGIPGLGLVSDTISRLTGRPLEVALGTADVFGPSTGSAGPSPQVADRGEYNAGAPRQQVVSQILRGNLGNLPQPSQQTPASVGQGTGGAIPSQASPPVPAPLPPPLPLSPFNAIALAAGPFRAYRG